MSDICYGSQRRITIVGTAMNHGRHLAGIGLERFGNGKDVRLLAKASPQRSRRVCFSQCQEMCTRRRTASFHSFSDESVDSTSLKRRVLYLIVSNFKFVHATANCSLPGTYDPSRALDYSTRHAGCLLQVRYRCYQSAANIKNSSCLQTASSCLLLYHP